jgi:hypothetical protein
MKLFTVVRCIYVAVGLDVSSAADRPLSTTAGWEQSLCDNGDWRMDHIGTAVDTCRAPAIGGIYRLLSTYYLEAWGA